MSSFGDKLPLDLRYPTERIGEQLGRAIAPMIEDLADALYVLAKHPALGHFPEDKAFNELVKVYLRESKRKTNEQA